MTAINTIRENAERLSRNSTDDPRGCGDAILAALAELEGQEPVAHVHWPLQGPPRLVWHSTAAMNAAILNGHESGPKPDVLLFATPVAQQPQAEAVTRDRIREIFMEHGFTIKEGQTDLKPYVYDAAAALLRAKQPQAEAVPELTSTEVNDACWAFVETMPHQLPGAIFNDLKPAIHAAICKYLAAAPKGQQT